MGFLKFLAFVAVVGTAAVIPFLDIASFLFKAAEEIQDPVAREQAAQTVRVSRIALCIIFGLFAVGFSQLVLRAARMKSFASSIPGHLTALGILGTFIGIFFGLYNFDVHNLNESIPLLLEGMKLAFTTSIAGLTTSTFLRVSHSVVVSITNEDPYLPSDADNGGTVVLIPGFREFSALGLASSNKQGTANNRV